MSREHCLRWFYPSHAARQIVRSPFRDRAHSDVHRFALSPSSAASATRTTSFRLGRHRLLLRDERTVSMFPTNDCFLTLRRRALAPRPFPYAFHRTEPLTFSRRHRRFGEPSGDCAGSSHPLFGLQLLFRSAASHDDRASDNLCHHRGFESWRFARFFFTTRLQWPRPLPPPARETPAACHDRDCLPSFGNPTRPLRASFPRREEPSGPWSIPRLRRRGPNRSDASSHARSPKTTEPLARPFTLKKRALYRELHNVFPR